MKALNITLVALACLCVLAASPKTYDPAIFTSNAVKSKEQFVFNGGMVQLNFPKLTTLSSPGGIWVWNSPDLQTIYVPKLKECNAFDCGVNGITSLAFPSLVTVHGFAVDYNPNLQTILIPNLASVTTWFIIQFNPLLEHLDCPYLVPANGCDLWLQGNALDQGSVDGILSRCVANPDFVSGQVLLDGGANSSPSAQGLADVETLRARGVTVTVNL